MIIPQIFVWLIPYYIHISAQMSSIKETFLSKIDIPLTLLNFSSQYSEFSETIICFLLYLSLSQNVRIDLVVLSIVRYPVVKPRTYHMLST